MNLVNFLAWLTAGAIIGWFAHRMVEVQQRHSYTVVPVEEDPNL